MEVPKSSLCLSGALVVLCQRLCGASPAFLRRLCLRFWRYCGIFAENSCTVAVNFRLLLSEPLRHFLGIDQASFELCCIGTGTTDPVIFRRCVCLQAASASKSHVGVARVAYAYVKVYFYILILSVAKYFQ